ncbi:hypothetical protein EV137_6886 [Kribbella pratensis]|uniref:Uncharacterized protein n=1 Tax=Kribbella pratensis TaxID=2512112 RepID=A0ABY2F743_9ACTN|nr:hypothetical protein EV137_6886 [Kribbella pratensis]
MPPTTRFTHGLMNRVVWDPLAPAGTWCPRGDQSGAAGSNPAPSQSL